MNKNIEKEQKDQKDEIRSFIEKKKTQNKALQKMMDQLDKGNMPIDNSKTK